MLEHLILEILVNLYEDTATMDAVENAYQKIFRTESGKQICREMFYSA